VRKTNTALQSTLNKQNHYDPFGQFAHYSIKVRGKGR